MKLGPLMREVIELDSDLAKLEVRGVTADSRQIGPGDLFVAVEGLTVDGHNYAEQAAQAGAVAVVAQRGLNCNVPCILVQDSARALALAASRLQGDPSASMVLMGITGTNGKTTTTYLMEGILETAGMRSGVIGTVGYRYDGIEEPAPFTTPTPVLLQQILRRMADHQCTHVVMEVSSHALQLGRVWGMSFAVAAFTHLTQDHLDLHGSMEAYLQAKQLLFARHLAPGGVAVVNLDGAGAEAICETVVRRGDVKLMGCSSQSRSADVRLEGCRFSVDGFKAMLVIGQERVELRSPLMGAYNADNVLMAAACCHAVGVDLTTIARGVAQVGGVPGRLERVDQDGDFAVLVDYAHTPDALERAMAVLRPVCQGRLIVVFGCGGDRDRGKRPLMGQAVARQADLAVVTSDNPRTEDPQLIIESILEGVRREKIPLVEARSKERGYRVQPDRRQAILEAVGAAETGDIVLIAGKGHEDYQILGRVKIHFDDREVAREALAGR